MLQVVVLRRRPRLFFGGTETRGEDSARAAASARAALTLLSVAAASDIPPGRPSAGAKVETVRSHTVIENPQK